MPEIDAPDIAFAGGEAAAAATIDDEIQEKPISLCIKGERG